MPIYTRFRGFISSLMLMLYALVPLPASAVDDGDRFRDWRARCESPGEGQPQRCFIFQTLVDQESEKPVLQVAIGYLPENNQPVAIYTVPLGVSLRQGISVQIDGGEANRIPFETCTPGGCIAGLPLNSERIAALKRGSKSQVTIYDNTGRSYTLEISLMGFTNGFNALR